MSQLVPQPFPPYSYVPGKFPHPVTDPRGHHSPIPPARANEPWWNNPAYLRGIDLFNHGYYWEAHEAWEAVWLDADRTGPLANFIKALIKLAAALVKAREGRAVGVQRHANRAEVLLQQTKVQWGSDEVYGLAVDPLIELAKRLAEGPEAVIDERDEAVVRVISQSLVPQPDEASDA